MFEIPVFGVPVFEVPVFGVPVFGVPLLGFLASWFSWTKFPGMKLPDNWSYVKWVWGISILSEASIGFWFELFELLMSLCCC